MEFCKSLKAKSHYKRIMKTAWMKAREDVFNSLEGTLKKLKLKVKTGDLDNSIEVFLP